MLLGGGCHRRGHRVHPALREEHPGDGVHVGDHRVDGQRVVRAHARVHRLEGEHPLRAGVAQVLVGLGRHPAEPADRDQARQVGGQQVERAVDVAVDEVGHLQLVELRGEVDVAAVAGGLVRADDLGDLVGHRLDVGVHVELRAVGEVGPVHRAHGGQLEPVGHLLADAGEGVLDQARHRQDRGPGVEAVARVLDHPGTPTRDGLALQDRHVPAGARQPKRGAQAAQPSADDHDVLRRSHDRPGIAHGESHAPTVGPRVDLGEWATPSGNPP